MEQRQQPPGIVDEWKNNLNLLLGLCAVHATFLSTFLRVPGSCGDRHFANILGMLGPVMMFFIGPLAKSPGLMRLGLAQIGFLLIHRVFRAWNDNWRNEIEHSRYIGDSWGSLLTTDRRAKRLLEPLACLGLGFLALGYDQPLGIFLMCGAASLTAVSDYIRMQEKAEERSTRDAMLTQQYLARRMGRD